MFKNVKIGMRLAFVFSCMIVITLVLGTVSINYMRRLSDLTYNLYRHPFTVTTATLKINANIIRIDRAMKDIMLSDDRAAIEAAVREITGYENEVYADFEI